MVWEKPHKTRKEELTEGLKDPKFIAAEKAILEFILLECAGRNISDSESIYPATIAIGKLVSGVACLHPEPEEAIREYLIIVEKTLRHYMSEGLKDPQIQICRQLAGRLPCEPVSLKNLYMKNEANG